MTEELTMIYDDFKMSNNKTISHLESELTKIRAGKASPAMLGGVMVDYYGAMTPIQQVANINTSDARTILVQPWEKPMLNEIARGIIKVVGRSKPRIILGFLLSTGILSMWISNTATALMMLPMALAIIHALPKGEKHQKFPLLLLLSVAYAASVGGMATLVGSPPNIQMASILEQNYQIDVDFIGWMKVALPISLSMILVIFVFFYFFIIFFNF